MEHLYFFGRFNFPHVGYLYVIRESVVQLTPTHGLTIVLSAENATWDKQALPMSARQAMFDIALQELPSKIRAQVHFSTIETTLNTGGYTIDTLKALQHHNSGSSAIVMGADAAIGIPNVHAGFTAWKEWQEILKRAELIIVPRGRFPDAHSVRAHLPTELSLATVLVTHPTSEELHASSTAITQGQTAFLPPAVFTYAKTHKLL
jgi:nicotinic acid mononucleotide adenylyltransferase